MKLPFLSLVLALCLAAIVRGYPSASQLGCRYDPSTTRDHTLSTAFTATQKKQWTLSASGQTYNAAGKLTGATLTVKVPANTKFIAFSVYVSSGALAVKSGLTSAQYSSVCTNKNIAHKSNASKTTGTTTSWVFTYTNTAGATSDVTARFTIMASRRSWYSVPAVTLKAKKTRVLRGIVAPLVHN